MVKRGVKQPKQVKPKTKNFKRPGKANKEVKLEKTEKKRRTKKDKNAPKKALSPFFCFLKVRRETLTKENPELSNKEKITQMSNEWKELEDSEKRTYVKLAEKDKIRYENEMKNYQKSETEDNSTKNSDSNSKKITKNKTENKKNKKGKKKEVESDEEDEEEEEEEEEKEEGGGGEGKGW